ncbi:MAG: hypothetical protein WBC22_00785 [Sedimentisphaerales bacterium]
MNDYKLHWPNRKWYPGDLSESGKQLWYSEEVDSGTRAIRAKTERKWAKWREKSC